ncbi:MAG: hypothetical protein H0T64_10705 [Pyrinomonadaceae bacterium]|nr:hypothetical protein [Pyrinomonadaceae bacterium]
MFWTSIAGQLRWPRKVVRLEIDGHSAGHRHWRYLGRYYRAGRFQVGNSPPHRKQESSSGSDKTTEKDKPSLLHRITPLAAPAFLAFINILLSAPTGLLISVASTIDWLASLANSTSESLNHWFFEMRSIEILRIANGLDEFLDRLASTQIKQPKS